MAFKRGFRIVVVSHGRLARAMLESAGMICGDLEDTTAVDLQPGETPEALGVQIEAALGHDGRPALLLTDLLGGTPHNVAALTCAQARGTGRVVACVSGANLGVLLEAATSVTALDAEAVGHLVDRGRAGLVDVMALLAERRAGRRSGVAE